MDTNPKPPPSFHFANEIEQSVISILWHEPDRLGGFCREIDPGVHLSQPHLRIILHALDLAYRELNSCDFAIIVQVVGELGLFEEVGGREGLNRVFAIHEHRSSRENIDAIFAHYVNMLKAYALGRSNHTPIYRFNRGDICLVQNLNKHGPNSPDLLGQGRIAGRAYRAIGFHQLSNDSYSISFIPE